MLACELTSLPPSSVIQTQGHRFENDKYLAAAPESAVRDSLPCHSLRKAVLTSSWQPRGKCLVWCHAREVRPKKKSISRSKDRHAGYIVGSQRVGAL